MSIIIGNIIAVYRKELQSYFASPLAYIIAGVFWLIIGYFLSYLLISFINQQQNIQQEVVDVPGVFVQSLLELMSSISLFILPMLSMGLYTEERKRGTLELLATSPITNWVVAVGKLLGVITFYFTMILPIAVFEAIVISGTNPPFSWKIFLLGHLGLLLMAGAILSLGMFISSLTNSTILSAILTFGLILFLWVIDMGASQLGNWTGDVLSHLALVKNYMNFVRGVFDSSSLILFVSYIILGIFLTAQSVDALRFQQRS